MRRLFPGRSGGARRLCRKLEQADGDVRVIPDDNRWPVETPVAALGAESGPEQIDFTRLDRGPRLVPEPSQLGDGTIEVARLDQVEPYGEPARVITNAAAVMEREEDGPRRKARFDVAPDRPGPFLCDSNVEDVSAAEPVDAV